MKHGLPELLLASFKFRTVSEPSRGLRMIELTDKHDAEERVFMYCKSATQLMLINFHLESGCVSSTL
jgi:hypothetical protein